MGIVNLAKAALEKAQNQMALIEATFNAMFDEASNWYAVIDDYNKNVENRADCQLAYDKALYNQNAQQGTVNALEAVANGLVVDEYGNQITVAQVISNCESNIRYANERNFSIEEVACYRIVRHFFFLTGICKFVVIKTRYEQNYSYRNRSRLRGRHDPGRRGCNRQRGCYRGI